MIHIAQEIYDLFENRINILVVDDESVVLNVVRDMFCSPLINLHTTDTVQEAYKIIEESNNPWHCWILDITIGKEESGFDILQRYPHFPFVVMLSGLGSMTIATEALEQGAMKVFDKSPESQELLFDDVCKASSLGFILNGKGTKHINTYYLLKSNLIPDASVWADQGYMSKRNLERICVSHSPFTPRFTIPLYYTLYYVLSLSKELIAPEYDFTRDDSDPHLQAFYKQQIEFVEKNFSRYEEVILKKDNVTSES